MQKDKAYDTATQNCVAKFAEKALVKKNTKDLIQDEMKLVGRNELLETKAKQTMK